MPREHLSSYATEGLRPAETQLASLSVTDDYPISRDRSGRIITRFADDMWDLTPYTHSPARIYIRGNRAGPLDDGNTELCKRLILWMLNGGSSCRTVAYLKVKYAALRVVIKAARSAGLLLSELREHPRVWRGIAANTPIATLQPLAAVLIDVYIDRDLLGFYILDPDEVETLKVSRSKRQHRQTLAIPSRISATIDGACLKLLSEFVDSSDRIRALYRITRDTAVWVEKQGGAKRPTIVGGPASPATAFPLLHGKTYRQISDALQLTRLLETGRNPESYDFGPMDLTRLLETVERVAAIVIQASTGMRAYEVGLLPLDCHEIRNDPSLGEVHLIRGTTTKTLRDANTYWVAAPGVELAVRAATITREIRDHVQHARDRAQTSAQRAKRELLFIRVRDIWSRGSWVRESCKSSHVRKLRQSEQLRRALSHIVPDEELRLTQEDLDEAIRLTPSLPSGALLVRDVWPLKSHQLRRTFVCDLSGLGVSVGAMSWQLKHRGLATTEHYRRNFFHLKMDRSLAAEIDDAAVAASFNFRDQIMGPDFVPMGAAPKSAVVRTLSLTSDAALERAARSGNVPFRRTTVGACLNPQPCPYGGWEYVAECAGCGHALADRRKRAHIERALSLVEARIFQSSSKEAAFVDSWKRQVEVLRGALDVTQESKAG
jgi:hypothetical protein